jgi:hypothetical protein
MLLATSTTDNIVSLYATPSDTSFNQQQQQQQYAGF